MTPSKEAQSECYFCGAVRSEVIEEHHVVPNEVILPQDESGVDTDQTIPLCANCHNKIHAAIDPLIRYMSDKLKDTPSDLQTGFEKASDLTEQ
jgi:hypothetical protein